ncbi:hypothetical protein HYALB_00010241 [Hymenoscyphus albidus]|uniref:Uncharacterized protein n=1 Tax=Hymenoscyphus albidus TaxID=595503 RepID=A0A9N9LI07_9HELO|nr:hypothetical protein HYALB_00010241 [Hymenoscyphus albidus]
MSPRKVPPDEFWVCCRIVGVTAGKRVFSISCGTPLPTNESTCTECTHYRCGGCTVWARQVVQVHAAKGGKRRSGSEGAGACFGSESENERERGGGEKESAESSGNEEVLELEEEEGVSCR